MAAYERDMIRTTIQRNYGPGQFKHAKKIGKDSHKVA